MKNLAALLLLAGVGAAGAFAGFQLILAIAADAWGTAVLCLLGLLVAIGAAYIFWRLLRLDA
ncbi:hypothetical protein [Vulcaniibacterium tengchongense]|uniref:Uncharacterized protein n=1 Tax=Vulcaniibacterium tengchongense TaxID=1273429 RepID=A0A3N4VJV2_9GAMM|nr:hypothetical protein [Vulcaniibacterium tengchongense]RPE77297.1 hypothetical protein EDC50_2563 [Vulcaniibacterium tengchongense]